MSTKLVWGPVWLLTLVLKPLLKRGHPWKRQRLTLDSWHTKGTPLARDFSLTFWVFLLLGPLFARIIFRQ